MSSGSVLAEHLSFGLLAATFPAGRIDAILARTRRESQRQRDLPARVVVYYVIALALFMEVSTQEVLRCLMEGLQWLCGDRPWKVPTTGGISQARARLGSEPLEALWREMCGPLGQPTTPGVFYRGWRLVSLDGMVLEVADSPANSTYFGRQSPPGHGRTAYPQLRCLALAECGTHCILDADMAPYRASEQGLAGPLLERALAPDMLCLADRGLFGYDLWQSARATGGHLLWRVSKILRLEPEQHLADGSYLARIYPGSRRRVARKGVLVRVIEYRLEGQDPQQEPYRLMTTLLDPEAAPALELAALYPQRWEIEGTFDELKTHQRGTAVVLRSKSPELVRQEFWGLLLAHRLIRGLMVQAAEGQNIDPDRTSFTHTINIIRRNLAALPGFFPSGSDDHPAPHPR
jgi:hypothetical protein